MTAALLDTRTLLWALADDARLPRPLAAAIDRTPSAFVISDVSIWEMAIKRSSGKLDIPDELPALLADLGFTAATLTRRQAWAVRDLPFHHRDPFDRLLIAQARDLALPIATADARLAAYDVTVTWR